MLMANVQLFLISKYVVDVQYLLEEIVLVYTMLFYLIFRERLRKWKGAGSFHIHSKTMKEQGRSGAGIQRGNYLAKYYGLLFFWGQK